jgi:uncharacterized LabA/DUF88 family protein
MRCAIFIDGAYLEHIAKQEFSLVQIDFAKLSIAMAGGKEILRTYYYDCLPYQSNPPTKEEKERFSKKQKFFTYLERLPRYAVRYGRLAYRGIDNRGKPIFEQKGIDTLLCVDMVNLGATHQISSVILLAGDSDCIPGIKIVKEHGVDVLLYHAQDKRNYHWQLWQECDERFPIDQGFIDRVKKLP